MSDDPAALARPEYSLLSAIIFDSCIQSKKIEFSLGIVCYGEITAELNWHYYLSE